MNNQKIEKLKYCLRTKWGDKRVLEVGIWILFQILITVAVCLIIEKCQCIKDLYHSIDYEEVCSLNYIDVITAQISTSFIVVSLTSILSSNSKVILWMDRIDLDLKQVGTGSFVAHTVRIFTSLIIGIVLFLVPSDYIYVNFLLSILVTLWFMNDLIRVNYDDASTYKRLEKYFDYIQKNYKEIHAEEEYKSILRSFETVTDKYVIDHDIEGFYKNMQFLERKSEWGTMEKICLAVGNDNLFILLDYFNMVMSDESIKEEYIKKLKTFWNKVKNEKTTVRYNALIGIITSNEI